MAAQCRNEPEKKKKLVSSDRFQRCVLVRWLTEINGWADWVIASVGAMAKLSSSNWAMMEGISTPWQPQKLGGKNVISSAILCVLQEDITHHLLSSSNRPWRASFIKEKLPLLKGTAGHLHVIQLDAYSGTNLSLPTLSIIVKVHGQQKGHDVGSHPHQTTLEQQLWTQTSEAILESIGEQQQLQESNKKVRI